MELYQSNGLSGPELVKQLRRLQQGAIEMLTATLPTDDDHEESEQVLAANQRHESSEPAVTDLTARSDLDVQLCNQRSTDCSAESERPCSVAVQACGGDSVSTATFSLPFQFELPDARQRLDE